MKIAAYSVVLVEAVSILAVKPDFPVAVIIIGVLLGIAGDIIFAAAVVTMRDSWRAGIAGEDNREMITSGIYKISMNPAFLGFDYVYLGILLMFFFGYYCFSRCLRLLCCICRHCRKKNIYKLLLVKVT